MISASSGMAVAAAALMLGVSAEIHAQGAPADRWRMVPAAPTTCFSDDDFNAKLDGAQAAIQAEIDRQKKVNAAAREAFDAMDMGEKARRMQAFMMKNPQAAMKMMQGEQAAGANVAASLPAANEAMKRLQGEWERHVAGFRASTEQALKPEQAKQKTFVEARTVLVGEAQVAVFKDPAAHARYAAMINEENAAYARACAPYFGAGGTTHKWLASYRTEVLDPVVDTDAGDIMVAQMAAMDLPGGGYRSTTALEQSLVYMRKLREAFNLRRATARPTIELTK